MFLVTVLVLRHYCAVTKQPCASCVSRLSYRIVSRDI